jgi:hypothetical protein
VAAVGGHEAEGRKAGVELTEGHDVFAEPSRRDASIGHSRVVLELYLPGDDPASLPAKQAVGMPSW